MRNIIILFLLFSAVALNAQTLNNATIFKAQSGNDYWQVTWGALKTDIGAGAGTVTSVGLALPSIFTVTNSPVTTTGTLTGTLNSQTANHIFAAPDGSAGTPVFRAMTANDVPTLPASKVTGAAITAGSTRISIAGSITGLTGGTIDVNEANIAINNLSGTLATNKGGTGLSSVGAAGTVLNSNGTTNQYTALSLTSNVAANGWTGLSLNIAPASTSLSGLVTVGSQTFAGTKQFNGAVTAVSGITAGSGGGGTGVIMQGGFAAKVNTQLTGLLTSSITLGENDHYVAVGQLTGSITLSLPACGQSNGQAGLTYTIHKTGTDAFAVIIDPNSTQTFSNGASTISLYGQTNTVTCTCLGGVSGPNTWALYYN